MANRMRQRALSSQSPNRDYLTGNCMTCASLMRWPRNIKEFRCTICETINDLAPLGSRQRSDADPVKPISLTHTRKLAQDCLRAYLVRAVCARSNDGSCGVSPQRADNRPQHQRAASGSELKPYARDPRPAPSQPYDSRYDFSENPTLRPNPLLPTSASPRKPRPVPGPTRASQGGATASGGPSRESDASHVFKPLQDYIISCFKSTANVNASFLDPRARPAARPTQASSRGQTSQDSQPITSQSTDKPLPEPPVCDVDPKLLMLGGVAKNGTWWVGGQAQSQGHGSTTRTESQSYTSTRPKQKSPQLIWEDVAEWYSIVTNPASNWSVICAELSQRSDYINPSESTLRRIEHNVLKAQYRLRKSLMKVMENMLKRPGGKITDSEEIRFLLILLENPLLHSDPQDVDENDKAQANLRNPSGTPVTGPQSGRHSRIIKRIIGLISNLPSELQTQLSHWWSKEQADRFIQIKELVAGFLTYRLLRQEAKSQGDDFDVLGGLIPQLQLGRSGASLHEEIAPRRSQKPQEAPKPNGYASDWQVQAASRVLSLLFDANNPYSPNHTEDPMSWSSETTTWRPSLAKGLFLPMSDFYVSLADYVDLVDDHARWDGKSQRFSFCQYPFLLSIWAKTHILESDWKKQMQGIAREAFFDSIMRGRNINQFLSLTVRRDCLVGDSLKAIGESLGSTTEEAKKALRVQFQGEEGIDAGGPRKEWFLLLVREVFSPEMGLFTYDEDSNYCYFNNFSFENTDQFFLVGAVLGLAIYNSIILDVALPPFMFRKLLSAAPSSFQPNPLTQVRQPMRYKLSDLAQYRPQLAKGLKQLLEFNGDVEETFCAHFVIDVDKYDTKVQVPLCEGGATRPVTNKNRREYVDLYVRYLLDTSVARQFEPFKRGFYSVCSGRAFSLFRPEEVELLVRGSDEEVDVSTLRGLAEYDNWKNPNPDGTEPVVSWFWEIFEEAAALDQRKLLLFITGSDRLPAAGASQAPIRLSCLGDDCGRFPIARTCFNLVSLWKYESKERLRSMLWRAVYESEGFGLK